MVAYLYIPCVYSIIVVSCLVFCMVTLLVDMFLNVYMCRVGGGWSDVQEIGDEKFELKQRKYVY